MAGGGIPLIEEPSGILGAFNPQKNDIPRWNRARQMYNAMVAQDPSMAEDWLRQFGPRMGLGEHYDTAMGVYDARKRRQQEVLNLTQPKQTFQDRGETAPSMLGQEDTAPDAELTNTVFPGTQSFSVPPDRAERAGRAEFNPPLYRGPGRDTGPDRPIPRAATGDISGTIGATAEIPPTVRPSGQYPRREPILRGGTVETPGLSVEEIARTRPDLAQTAIKYIPEVQKADMESIGDQAAIRIAQAVKRGEMSFEEAWNKWGDQALYSVAGQKMADAFKDKIAIENTRKDTERRERARQTITEEIGRLKSTGDKNDAEDARFLEMELLGDKPDYGTLLQKVHENRQRRDDTQRQREEAMYKPIEVEVGGVKVPHLYQRDAQGRLALDSGGMPQLVPVPGIDTTTAVRLDQMKDLSKARYLAISKSHPDPEIRRQARESYDELVKGEKGVAAAGVPKENASSLKEQEARTNMMTTLDAVEQSVREHPDWVGGMKAQVLWNAYRGTFLPESARFLTANRVPPDYAVFATNLGSYTAERIHELAGSALTAGEIQRYTQFIPNVSHGEKLFRAELLAARRALVIISEYHNNRINGMSHPDAKAKAEAAWAANIADIQQKTAAMRPQAPAGNDANSYMMGNGVSP